MAQTLKIISGDWVTNPASGRPTLISELPKIKQDISEFFAVHVLPNGFGSGVEQLVGIVEISQEMFVSVTDKQIRDGISTFINLIRSNPRVQRSAVERIIGISNLKVSADPVDPTKYIYSVNIITEAGVAATIVNSIPIQ